MQDKNGIHPLAADEIAYVSGGSVDAPDGSPELAIGGGIKLVFKVLKELSESKAVRNMLIAAEASTYLGSDTPQPVDKPVGGANGSGAVGGPSA